MDEDKIRLQLIDDAISRIKTMPQIGLERSKTIDDTSKLKENPTQIENEIIQVITQQLILTEQKITKYKSKYNKDKYKQIDRTTAQVDPEEVVKNTYLSHPNLEVMKFIIDRIWATVTTRKRENEDDIEIVLEEPLMRSHSCIGKSYKEKDLIRVMDVLIKNVSISVIDNVLYNSIEKLYHVNKDFVRLNSIDFVNLHSDQIIRGVKTFLQPIIAGKIIKQGGTSNQILLANGDTIEKDQLEYEPIENARYSSIAYRMYESRAQGTVTTQKVDGTPTNIPLNAVLFAQKVYGNPIDWTGAIAMDCLINPNGNVIINTLCQINLPEDFCVQVCDSYAIHNQSA
ncbi:MAG: hypothetical protein EZS28_011475 [Streblomastix strix]|uniref:Uncharacterized protein n=1 Tax=Streblomastix strix TaxID=222440 RepID=A0A5J4WF89_9EUKA|nr:MAG: hypothetical protein EZS28_011475 [Streblomastix strix]